MLPLGEDLLFTCSTHVIAVSHLEVGRIIKFTIKY